MLQRAIVYFNIILWGFSSCVSGYSQSDSVKKVIYNSEFRFKDGLYLNFAQVKNNHPVLKERLVANVGAEDERFFDLILADKQITYFDDFGTKQQTTAKSLWGYTMNGILYIRLYDSYNRISYVGNICHFIATITVTNRSTDPYFYSPYYYNRSLYSSSGATSSEMKQFLIDFDSGKVYDYDEKSVGVLLMKDSLLYDEYSTLKKKKREQLKFFYIRKFNEKHPLMLPE